MPRERGSFPRDRESAESCPPHPEDMGQRICADYHPTNGGYWIAHNDAEWAFYTARRAAGDRCDFARLRKMREAAGDVRSGQGRLFGERDQEIKGRRQREWATV